MSKKNIGLIAGIVAQLGMGIPCILSLFFHIYLGKLEYILAVPGILGFIVGLVCTNFLGLAVVWKIIKGIFTWVMNVFVLPLAIMLGPILCLMALVIIIFSMFAVPLLYVFMGYIKMS